MTRRRNRPVKMDELLNKNIAGSPYVQDRQDLFGLEVELEGQNVETTKQSIADFWARHKDGSLRVKPGDPKAQAVEYVFNKPMTIEDTEKAVSVLCQYLNGPTVKVFDSYRTSIHVHINCLNDTIRTVVNFITLAIIFDELFVSQNGQTRIGNNFCLRTRDAEGQVNDLIQAITQYGNPFSAVPAHNRYSSVNMVSLAKFGTIEFRSLECTIDSKRIMHWVQTIQALKTAARKYENPREIIATFSRKGPLGFITANLGPMAHKYLAVPEYHGMLHTGMRLAQDFAFCSEWVVPNKLDLKEEKDEEKKLLDLQKRLALAYGVSLQMAKSMMDAQGPDFDWEQYLINMNAPPPPVGQDWFQPAAPQPAWDINHIAPPPGHAAVVAAFDELHNVPDDDDLVDDFNDDEDDDDDL